MIRKMTEHYMALADTAPGRRAALTLIVLAVSAFMVVLIGCNGEPPEPPPPPEPSPCPVICGPNEVLDEEHCVCIPVPPEPEPPPPPAPDPPGGAVPENYLTLTRAQDILDYQNSQWEGLELELRANHFAGYIDPADVASNCGWSCQPFFGTSPAEMAWFAETGAALEAEGERLMENLGLVNRRCVASHPEHDPRFCGRSEVRREVWNAFEAAFLDHKDTWSAWRDAVSPDNCPALASQLNANGKPERWDSIRGFCRKMNLHGLRSCQ